MYHFLNYSTTLTSWGSLVQSQYAPPSESKENSASRRCCAFWGVFRFSLMRIFAVSIFAISIFLASNYAAMVISASH